MSPNFDAASDITSDAEAGTEFFKHIHLELSHSRDGGIDRPMPQVATEELARGVESKPLSTRETIPVPHYRRPYVNRSQKLHREPESRHVIYLSEEIRYHHENRRPYVPNRLPSVTRIRKPSPPIGEVIRSAERPPDPNRRHLPAGFERTIASYGTGSLYGS